MRMTEPAMRAQRLIGGVAGALLAALAMPGAAVAQSSGGGGPLSYPIPTLLLWTWAGVCSVGQLSKPLRPA